MQVKNNQNNRWKGLDMLIVLAASWGIGDMARHIVLHDQAAWWRVLILVLSAFATGCVIGRTHFRPAQEATEPNDSRNNPISTESNSE